MIIADVVIEDFRVYSLIVSDSLLESIVTTTVRQTACQHKTGENTQHTLQYPINTNNNNNDN